MSVIVLKKASVRMEEFPWGEAGMACGRSLQNSARFDLGRCILKPGCGNTPHIHPNCCEILRVESGRIAHRYGGRSVDMEPGDTITIPAGGVSRRRQPRRGGGGNDHRLPTPPTDRLTFPFWNPAREVTMDKKSALRASLSTPPKSGPASSAAAPTPFGTSIRPCSSAMSTSSPSATSTCQKRRHSPNNLAQGAPTPTTMRCSKGNPRRRVCRGRIPEASRLSHYRPSPACRPG